MLVKSKRFRVYQLFNLPEVVIAQSLEMRAKSLVVVWLQKED